MDDQSEWISLSIYISLYKCCIYKIDTRLILADCDLQQQQSGLCKRLHYASALVSRSFINVTCAVNLASCWGIQQYTSCQKRTRGQ